MRKNEKVEIVKEGKPIEKHECDWTYQLNLDTPENTCDFKRICRYCGKVERITKVTEKLDFDDLYNKFHGKAE